jgi:hypothetical protein
MRHLGVEISRRVLSPYLYNRCKIAINKEEA